MLRDTFIDFLSDTMSSSDTLSTPFSLLTSIRYDPFLLSQSWNNDQDGNPCPYLLLAHHLDRLRDAVQQHDWNVDGDTAGVLTIKTLRSVCDSALSEHSDTPQPAAFKIRVLLSKTGDFTASAAVISPLSFDPTSPSFFNPTRDNPVLFSPVVLVQLDSQPTAPSIFTLTKTTKRDVYDEARARNGVPTIITSSPLVLHKDNSQDRKPDDVLLYNVENSVTETSIYNIALYRSSRWVTPPVTAGLLPGVMRRWLLEQGRISEAQNGDLLHQNIQENEWILLFNAVQGCRLGRIRLHRIHEL